MVQPARLIHRPLCTDEDAILVVDPSVGHGDRKGELVACYWRRGIVLFKNDSGYLYPLAGWIIDAVTRYVELVARREEHARFVGERVRLIIGEKV